MTTETKMTAREYLGQAYLLDQRIRSKIRQIGLLRQNAAAVSAVCGDTRVQASKNRSRMENVLLKLYDQERELDEEIDRLVELKEEIRRTIDAVPDPACGYLLELRYLCFYDWKDVARIMGISENYIFKLHRKALAMVAVPQKGEF